MPTQVYLVADIDFNSNYESVVDFDTIELQHSYFSSKRLLGYDYKSVWVRPERNYMRVNIPYMVCKNYSYIMYENEDVSGNKKTFYAFIEDVLYTDAKTTTLVLKLDVWQTYMFDYNIKDSFIDREHQDRFTKIGQTITPKYNVVPEEINLGENMVVKDVLELTGSEELLDKHSLEWFVVVTSDNDNMTDDYVLRNKSIQFSYNLFLVPQYKDSITKKLYFLYGTQPTVYKELERTDVLQAFAKDKRTMGIYKLPYSPIDFNLEIITVDNKTEYLLDFDMAGVRFTRYKESEHYEFGDRWLVQISHIDYIKLLNEVGYFEIDTPNTTALSPSANKRMELETKLLTKPYRSYALIGAGLSDPLMLEHRLLQSSTLTKTKELCFNYGFDPTIKFRAYFKNYLNDNGLDNFSESSVLDEYPLVTDDYLNYLATQKASAQAGMGVNIGTTILGLTALGVGVAVASPIAVPLGFVASGMAISGVSNIVQQLGKVQSLKQAPMSSRTIGSTLNYNLTNGLDKVKLLKKEVEEPYMKIAYEFMFRYGYKANTMGVPNLRSRIWFNYIKTTTINISGSITNEVKKELENIYAKGTTIWHYRDNYKTDFEMFNYDRENLEMKLIGGV